MKKQIPEKHEVGLIKNFTNKCKYSLQGLSYCFKNESSFLLTTILGCVIIILGILFDISFIEWVISFGSLALILITELINTAIESIVDMITLDYNENAKIAKDCGSAATGITSVLTGIVNLIIFVPHIIKWIIKTF